MSIHYNDFCLSGWVPHSFEETAQRLLEIDSSIKIEELLFVDNTGQRNRTTFGDGSLVSDMQGIIEIDYQAIQKMECILRPRAISTAIQVWLYRGSASSPETIIDGPMYMGHLLKGAASPEQALRSMTEVLVHVARHLEAGFLHVADEDDDSMTLRARDLRLPSICGIYPRTMLEGCIEPLRTSGAVIEDAPDHGYLILWIASIRELLDDASARAPVLDILRARLSGVVC